MSGLKVYLSSPYMEFREIRKKFLDQIQARAYLYDIVAMEDYRAEDKDALEKCRDDVNECNIYVCILGQHYGSMARDGNGMVTGKSFTHWEYHTACERKNRGDDIERIILLKSGDVQDDKLKAWRQEIGQSQLLTQYFDTEEDIPHLILESLDNFTLQRVKAYPRPKNVMREKIYLCNRVEQDLEFTTAIDNDPVQFFLLKGHDKDLPHYFIRRKEMEFEDLSLKWDNIDIKPSIPNGVMDFQKVETYIKAQIFTKLKWPKFKLPKDVTVEGLIEYMTEKNIDYLSISWFIESIYWKNDKLHEFIGSFFNEYNKMNQQLKTDKRIIFFGVLCYVDNPGISEEEFNKRIDKIVWEHNLPPFDKINCRDIKDWLADNKIETINARCDELISLYVKDIATRDLYFSEVESGLLKIIQLYNSD